EVIEPTMNKAREDLIAGGYACQIEITTQSDPQYATRGTPYAVGIRIKTSRDKRATQALLSYLYYEGGYGGQSLSRHTYIDGGPHGPEKTSPVALEAMDVARIESELEAFLKRVFAPH